MEDEVKSELNLEFTVKETVNNKTKKLVKTEDETELIIKPKKKSSDSKKISSISQK